MTTCPSALGVPLQAAEHVVPLRGDPSGLLEWLAKARCLVTFKDGKDVEAKRLALEAIVRAWIRLM